MPNWKSPGPDLVQGFWLKNFSSLHERVRLQLKECLDSGFVPSWLTRGRTSLLQKDKSKCNIASNYRRITCLPLMWKLLTGVIADQIYAHLLNSMEKWKVMLCSGNSELGEFEIKRHIFQGDSLSPLVFILALIQLSLILGKERQYPYYNIQQHLLVGRKKNCRL